MAILRGTATSVTPKTASILDGKRVKWEPLAVDESRYSITILQGLDQTGKTHFAFTAPAPILIMTFDPANLRGVARKYAGIKDIQVATFQMPKGLIATSELAAVAKAEAKRYTETFTAAVEGDFRTIIMDREDEAWELYRYEEFDGNASAKPHHYVQLNMAYKAMLKLCEKNKKNLIMIDSIKDEYKSNKPTGETIRAGFKQLGLLSQVVIETSRNNYDKFSMQVIACRDDSRFNGTMIDHGANSALDARLTEMTGERPVNAETGEAEWWGQNGLDFSLVMAYLIGGHPNEWK